MWLTPLIEAYERVYWSLRELGYDSRTADEATAWFAALGALIWLWLAVEIFTSL